MSITGSECDTGILDCKNIQNVPSRIKDLVKLEVLNLTMNDIKYISDEINHPSKNQNPKLKINAIMN